MPVPFENPSSAKELTGRIMGIVVLLFVGIFFSEAACAQGSRPKLKVRVQSFPGVQRVTVTTANKLPLRGDLVLQVVARLHDYRSTQMMVYKELVIPAGQTSAAIEVPVLVPKNSWYVLNVHVEQDNNGVYSSRDIMTTQINSGNNWQHDDYELFVSSNISSIPERSFLCGKKGQTSFGTSGLGVSDPAILPSFLQLAPYYELQNIISKGSVTSDISFLQNSNERFKSTHPNDFFENWASLNSFRSILISYEDLSLLNKSNTKIEALRYWVAAGGQLIVFNCGPDFANRNKVVAIVQGGRTTPLDPDWQQPSAELAAMKQFIGAQNWYQNPAGIVIPQNQVKDGLKPFVKLDEISGQLLLRTGFMKGGILVIDDDMTKWKSQDWSVLYNSIQLSRSGVDRTIGERGIAGDYNHRFRIPGIGSPPVVAFQILIALFVVVIGPGFYFFFNTTGRLYLLLVSTPLFALFAVVALFGYGILSDGFAIRGRMHSVTEIDHSTSTAFTHARHVYYSGVSPRECVYDDQTVVADTRMEFSPMTSLRYRDNDLRVSGGQIRARSPFQLVSFKCFETDRQLSFAMNSGDGKSATISNGFENRVKLAVVRTAKGWFLAENIDPNTTATASQVEFENAKSKIRELTFTPQVKERRRTRRRRNWYGNIVKGSWGHSDQLILSLGSSGFKKENMQVNSYIAIMDSNDLVADPQPDTIYGENELHVIVGKW